MPGRVRSLDRRRIRLNDALQAHIEYLARLAGVSPDDIVNFVLSEVLEIDEPSQPAPGAARRPTPRPSHPADVIPITRRRVPPGKPLAVSPDPLPALDLRDASYLRRQAAEARLHARAARAHAADVCHAAKGARSRADQALQTLGAYC